MKAYTKQKIISGFLLILIIFSCTNTVFATSSQLGSIAIEFELENTKFDLYKIGKVSDNGLELLDEFKKYNVDIYSENSADTLAVYVKRDNVLPYASKITDSNGNTEFEKLEKGVYLITGQDFTLNGFTYEISSSIVSIPYVENDKEYLNVKAKIKYQKTDDKDGKTDIKVLKVWENYSENKIYPSVKVQLLKDWEVYDTVVLNEENNWKYIWSDMDKNHNWSVAEEKVEDGYLVEIENDNFVYTITNAETTVESTPPSEPTIPINTNSTPQVVTTEPTNLTQTGQLNWPIPVLVIMGAVLIIVGVALMGKKNEKQ